MDSFGLGHMTRQIALVRALNGKTDISVMSSKYLSIIKKSLPEVKVQQTNIGIRLVRKNLSIDIEKTIELNKDFDEYFEKRVNEEMTRLRREMPDLIVADIPAEIFIAAEAVGIPVVAVSNFGWTIILEHIFGRNHEYKTYVDAYSKATKTFILPFNEPMGEFSNKKLVGLLRRRITKKLPKRNGILAAFGKSGSIRLGKGFYRIPESETEGQDYVAAAEAVFAKPAYGTVSEAVSAGVPMFIKKRKDFPESDYILRQIEWKKVVPEEANAEEWITNEMKNIDFDAIERMKKKYSINGDREIAQEIMKML